MTESSARAFSVSDLQPARRRAAPICFDEQGVHIWLCLRNRFVSSDEFKRCVLSHYADVLPADWRFSIGAQGKPRLADTSHALDFNLSHSGEWLACAVTAGQPVGLDIEACKPERKVMTLARRFFREEEVAALGCCDDATANDRFYDFWTLKESAVKARGGLLVSGLESRGFALAYESDPVPENGRIGLTTAADADTAQYCLLDPVSGYRLAICWLPDSDLQPELRVFELCDADLPRVLDLPLRASTWLN